MESLVSMAYPLKFPVVEYCFNVSRVSIEMVSPFIINIVSACPLHLQRQNNTRAVIAIKYLTVLNHDLQRWCISSGGNSKRVTVPRVQTYFDKLNYKFTQTPPLIMH